MRKGDMKNKNFLPVFLFVVIFVFAGCSDATNRYSTPVEFIFPIDGFSGKVVLSVENETFPISFDSIVIEMTTFIERPYILAATNWFGLEVFVDNEWVRLPVEFSWIERPHYLSDEHSHVFRIDNYDTVDFTDRANVMYLRDIEIGQYRIVSEVSLFHENDLEGLPVWQGYVYAEFEIVG